MRLLYTAIFTLCIPLILVRLWWRGKKVPAYRQRWRERFGFIPPRQNDRPTLWVHTVSVGEFIAARPMLDKLLQLESYNVAITTTTPTGSERVTEAYGNKVYHCYLPYDLPFCLAPFFKRINPTIAIFLETELWPNTLHGCYKRNIPALLANGRLSKKSAKGYQKFSSLTTPMLQKLTAAAIQNTDDAARFEALGLARKKISITGSIKFDIAITAAQAQAAQTLKKALAGEDESPIWIAASTHKGEDELVLDAYSRAREKIKHLKLILVPRHPDRFNQVFQLCQNRGHTTLRRSETKDTTESKAFANFDILLGDTMGEMMLLYGCADVTFVGGSFVENGGHNTIEPAVWQLPIITGPSQFNFADVSQQLINAGGQTIVHTAAELAEQLHTLLTTSEGRQSGKAAANVAKSNQGALSRLMGLINQTLQHDTSRPQRNHQ